jgi:site-specific DNA recombinase
VVLRAAIYDRVSLDKRQGRSVAEQDVENRAACDEHGWTVAEVYCDNDRSASRFARKVREDWPRLAADLDAGKHEVLVLWEPSRGSRELELWAGLLNACRRRGVLVHVTSHRHTYDLSNPREWRTLAEDGVDSAYESEKASQRVRRALAANATAGRPHGRHAYGWQRLYDVETGRSRDVVNPAEAAIVCEVADRIIGGDSLRGIVADLNRRGVPSPTGKPWAKPMLRHVVQRERNVAQRIHHGQVVGNGEWEPILPLSKWEQVRAILADPQRRTATSTVAVHLLSGLARCGVCDGPIRASTNRTVPSYRCAEQSCVSRNRRDVDEFVTAIVVRFLARRDAAMLHAPARADVRRAAEEAAQLRARLDNAADDYSDGKIDARQLERITARLSPRIEAAEARSRVVDDAPLLDGLIGNPRAAEIWRTLPLSRRRAVVDLLMDIRVLRARQGAREFDAESVKITPRRRPAG